ncbi:hydrogen peroxide-inducible genes activator [Legionella oakridgensis]|uniref:Transcriptional regulator n=2 Tax=Legionella oakridgensis TaxID=29423 RepID=W0BAU7_9GAMM|nr:hydrogen peroxide-inducible genes activator [Legionella oakridgensis]AHE66975.1 transcriptional regulator [Legionella oakridgensis ATCC 33761 = DSM 21215]KTD38369.1 LysR family transcriptional regulator [Legionella oakridgensis]STY20077.1 LysR family transcriptional regulator [Legionella longbeachae]
MIKLPSIRHLQYLIALYDHQHFGQAAESCFISQSTLSAAITNLEEQLQAQLLERDHKTFIFTPLGHEIVRTGRKIIQDYATLVEHARYHGQPMKGIMRLGCIPTIAPFILSDLMTLTKKRYPEIQMLLREDTTENALDALTKGYLDLVILALPYETNQFHTRVLARDPFKLVLHHDWLTKGFTKDMHQWPDESVFLLEREHCMTNHALMACQLRDKKKINPFFATSLHTLTEMVNHKLGVTFLSQLAIQSGILLKTNLVALTPTAEQAYREIGIAWRKSSVRQQEFRLIGDMITELLANKGIHA